MNDEEIISFQCLERIIPDGSFWVLERDNAGNDNNFYIMMIIIILLLLLLLLKQVSYISNWI